LRFIEYPLDRHSAVSHPLSKHDLNECPT